MTAHFDFQKVQDDYLRLVNEKKEIEQKIKLNAADETALAGLRSDYRAVTDELEKLYTANIEYFKDTQKYY